MPPDLLTSDDVCAYLQISKSTLKALVRSGRLPTRRIGTGRGKLLRWTESDLAQYLDSCRVVPPQKPAPKQIRNVVITDYVK